MSAAPVSSSAAAVESAPPLAIVQLPAKKLPASVGLLAAIKATEKRTFPTSEAFAFDDELKKRNTVLLCAYYGSSTSPELAGYLVYVRSKLVTRIHKVCVVEKHRGKGVGKRMMEEAVGMLKRGGAGKVDLWVDVGRDAARGLYERCGFEERETVEGYYGAGRGAVRMELEL